MLGKQLAWYGGGVSRAGARFLAAAGGPDRLVFPVVGGQVHPQQQHQKQQRRQTRYITTTPTQKHKLPDGSDCGSDHGAASAGGRGGGGAKLTRLQHLRRENEVIAAIADLKLPSKVDSALIDDNGGKCNNLTPYRPNIESTSVCRHKQQHVYTCKRCARTCLRFGTAVYSSFLPLFPPHPDPPSQTTRRDSLRNGTGGYRHAGGIHPSRWNDIVGNFVDAFHG